MKQEIKNRIALIKQGEVPEGYKKTKVGICPLEWDSVLFKTFINEKKILSSDESKYPLFSLTIKDGVSAKTERYERSHLVKSKKDSYKIVDYHDFVYNPMNIRFGAVARSEINYKVLVSRYYDVFNINNYASSDYFKYYLISDVILKFYNKVATGSLEEKKRVHFSDFLKFYLALPKKKEQQNIAEILMKWDEMVELQENYIEKLELRKKALMQKLLKPKLNWKHIKLDSVMKFSKKTPIKNIKNYKLLTVKLHLNGIELTNKIPNDTKKRRQYYLRLPNELLIGRQNYHNGGIGFVPFNAKGFIASNAISSIITKDDNDILFLYFYLSNPNFYKKVGYMIGGTGQKEISENQFKNLNLIYPLDIKEQQHIADILSKADEEIELQNSKLEKLKEQRKSLMQLLLTGIVRVA